MLGNVPTEIWGLSIFFGGIALVVASIIGFHFKEVHLWIVDFELSKPIQVQSRRQKMLSVLAGLVFVVIGVVLAFGGPDTKPVLPNHFPTPSPAPTSSLAVTMTSTATTVAKTENGVPFPPRPSELLVANFTSCNRETNLGTGTSANDNRFRDNLKIEPAPGDSQANGCVVVLDYGEAGGGWFAVPLPNVDLTSYRSVVFDLRVSALADSCQIAVKLRSLEGRVAETRIVELSEQWKTVSLDFSDASWSASPLAFNAVKELVFEITFSGVVYIDNIRFRR